MKLLAAIKREERKLEKQLGKVQHQLNRVRPRGVRVAMLSVIHERGRKLGLRTIS